MTQSNRAFALWVDKQDICDIRVVEMKTVPLLPGQIRIKIARFGLSANNITYAVTGNTFGYWGFFPADDMNDTYGIVPLWGFADVVESANSDVPVGRRIFGYLPMASHWILQADKLNDQGFVDTLPSRKSNSPVYDSYLYCGSDPNYDPAREVWQANFRPLFLTSFALAHYIASETVETVSTIVLTSASSKTAIGCAMLLAKMPHIDVVGLTSSDNVAFVENLDCYDEVLEYGQVPNMRYKTPVWVLDFAGNKALLQQLQEIFDHLHHTTLFIGITDIEAQQNKPAGKLKGEVFFAPEHIKLLIKLWGHERFMREYGHAWQQVVQGIEAQYCIDEFSGVDALIQRYQQLVKAEIPPNQLLFGEF